ncbi:heterokaryon incompatibility protein-domain-containing protein [Cladochytrium replicatum]|nr:heterokaryon incompatibility protein-domain-containing protein [Cladochytrium replicatum]
MASQVTSDYAAGSSRWRIPRIPWSRPLRHLRFSGKFSPAVAAEAAEPSLSNVANSLTDQRTKYKLPTRSAEDEYPKRIFNVELMKSELVTPEIQESIAVEGYAIVSHVWGPWWRQIDIPGVPWPVPLHKLEKFNSLTAYANAQQYKWLWMDVLCIDQQNEEEKAAEMTKMKSFYANAMVAIIVVDCGTLIAEETLWRVLPKWPITVEEVPLIGELGAGISHDFAQMQAAIAPLFADEWFWRVWTYQECILPMNTEIICSHGHRSKHTLDDWLEVARVLQSAHSTGYPGALPIQNHWRDGRAFTSISDLAVIRRKFLSGEQLQIAPIVASLGARNCFIKDDRLFGILGLITYGKYLTVEYGDVIEAWKRVSRLAVEHGDFSMLAFKTPPAVVMRDAKVVHPVLRDVAGAVKDGWSWFGPLMGQVPVYEYTRLDPITTISLSKPGTSSELPTVTEDGTLKLNAALLGKVSWVKKDEGLTDTDPADIMELISQFIVEGGATKDVVVDWIVSMLPTSAHAAIAVAPAVVQNCIDLGDARNWNQATYDDIENEYRRDGKEGDHGMWDLRNMVEDAITHFANQWRAQGTGRAAIVTEADGKKHLVVLDREVGVETQVFGYGWVDRAEGRRGLMTFVCDRHGDGADCGEGDVHKVYARTTPIHNVQAENLKIVPTYLQ